MNDAVVLRQPGGTFPAPVLLDDGSDREVPGRGSPVLVRVFTPPVVDGVYLHLHLHPGGGVLGSASSSDARLWELAQGLSMAVVSVEHRLAPEYPFPAGAEDCVDAARWLATTSAATFGTTSRIVGGESQGAYWRRKSLCRSARDGIMTRCRESTSGTRRPAVFHKLVTTATASYFQGRTIPICNLHRHPACF